tara:strand:- start:27079 stop:27501 length:423 start_codon:yes stop_codon:yes gene_type:complete
MIVGKNDANSYIFKQMTHLLKISCLFVVAVLFIGITTTAESADLYHVHDFSLGESNQQSEIIPISTPELYGINRQGPSAVNLLRILPVTNAKNNNNEIPNLGLFSEIPIRRAVSIYLSFSKDINQSLTIRELLFPFHHFL